MMLGLGAMSVSDSYVEKLNMHKDTTASHSDLSLIFCVYAEYTDTYTFNMYNNLDIEIFHTWQCWLVAVPSLG